MSKKVLSIVLAVCLLIGCVPVLASAAEQSGDVGSIHWALSEDGVLTLSGTGVVTDGSDSGVPATDIPWGSSQSTLAETVKEIVIEEGITKVGMYSLGYCVNTKIVRLPASLTETEMYSFIKMAPPFRSIEEVYYAGAFEQYLSIKGITSNGALPLGNVGEMSQYHTISEIHCSDITVCSTVDQTLADGSMLTWAAKFGKILSTDVNETPKTGVSIAGQTGVYSTAKKLTLPAEESGAPITVFGKSSVPASACEELTIPEGFLGLENDALSSEKFPKLTTLRLPKSIELLGYYEVQPPVFFKFVNLPKTLKDLYFNGTRAEWNELFPENEVDGGSDYPDATKAMDVDKLIKDNLTDKGITLHFSDGTTIEGKKTDPKPSQPGGNTPSTPSAPSDDEPIVETSTTESGNLVTTTTQPNGDQELKVETLTGETIANIKLPADPGKGKEFADVKSGAWYEGAVDKATAYGLFGGTSETTFAPGAEMTRGMLAQVLYNLSGKTRYGVGEGTFTDVKNGAWYVNAVDWAAKVGVTSGTGSGGFSPNQSITREQLVTMLYNYAKAIGMDRKSSAGLERFPDAGKISGYAKEAMQWAVADGFISGRADNGENYIAPQGTATRAEVAAVLVKFTERLK